MLRVWGAFMSQPEGMLKMMSAFKAYRLAQSKPS
jgi:hypothetical protein